MEAFSTDVRSVPKGGSPYSEETYLYTLIEWALAGKNVGDGYGFPFDQAYLSFLNRLYELRRTLRLMKLDTRSSFAGDVLAVLRPVWYDGEISTAYESLQKKVVVFDRLRCAMRIAEPGGKLGLNDPGSGEIDTIKEQVEQFLVQLCKDDSLQGNRLLKMRLQLEKYWEKLFTAPIPITRQGETYMIYPQRTNNSCEQFFRGLKHGYCRTSGHAGMTKTLSAMLSATPLVRNLGSQDYLNLICGGASSLEERFAQIDVAKIRKMLAVESESVQTVHPKIKKLVKDPGLPKRLLKLFRKSA